MPQANGSLVGRQFKAVHDVLLKDLTGTIIERISKGTRVCVLETKKATTHVSHRKNQTLLHLSTANGKHGWCPLKDDKYVQQFVKCKAAPRQNSSSGPGDTVLGPFPSLESAGHRIDLELGDYVEILPAQNNIIKGTRNRKGVVKWIGTPHWATSGRRVESLIWAGLELDSKFTGKHDGMVNNQRYFKCTKGQGIFVKCMHLNVLYTRGERKAFTRARSLSLDGRPNVPFFRTRSGGASDDTSARNDVEKCHLMPGQARSTRSTGFSPSTTPAETRPSGGPQGGEERKTRGPDRADRAGDRGQPGGNADFSLWQEKPAARKQKSHSDVDDEEAEDSQENKKLNLSERFRPRRRVRPDTPQDPALAKILLGHDQEADNFGLHGSSSPGARAGASVKQKQSVQQQLITGGAILMALKALPPDSPVDADLDEFERRTSEVADLVSGLKDGRPEDVKDLPSPPKDPPQQAPVPVNSIPQHLPTPQKRRIMRRDESDHAHPEPISPPGHQIQEPEPQEQEQEGYAAPLFGILSEPRDSGPISPRDYLNQGYAAPLFGMASYAPEAGSHQVEAEANHHQVEAEADKHQVEAEADDHQVEPGAEMKDTSFQPEEEEDPTSDEEAPTNDVPRKLHAQAPPAAQEDENPGGPAANEAREVHTKGRPLTKNKTEVQAEPASTEALAKDVNALTEAFKSLRGVTFDEFEKGDRGRGELKDEIARLQKELEEARAEILPLRKAVEDQARLKEEQEEARTEIMKLRKAVEDKTAIQSLKTAVEELNNRFNVMQGRMTSVEEKVDAHDISMKEYCERTTEELQSKLQEISHSLLAAQGSDRAAKPCDEENHEKHEGKSETTAPPPNVPMTLRSQPPEPEQKEFTPELMAMVAMEIASIEEQEQFQGVAESNRRMVTQEEANRAEETFTFSGLKSALPLTTLREEKIARVPKKKKKKKKNAKIVKKRMRFDYAGPMEPGMYRECKVPTNWSSEPKREVKLVHDSVIADNNRVLEFPDGSTYAFDGEEKAADEAWRLNALQSKAAGNPDDASDEEEEEDGPQPGLKKTGSRFTVLDEEAGGRSQVEREAQRKATAFATLKRMNIATPEDFERKTGLKVDEHISGVLKQLNLGREIGDDLEDDGDYLETDTPDSDASRSDASGRDPQLHEEPSFGVLPKFPSAKGLISMAEVAVEVVGEQQAGTLPDGPPEQFEIRTVEYPPSVED